KEDEQRREMAQEVNLVAEQIIRTLGRLGFKEVITKGNRTVTRYVQFSEAVVTPDQIHLKLAASRQGLAGGTIDLLPNNVSATEILTAKTMADLSLSLEREVWSPQINENISYSRGGWIVVERMGLYEGIPKKVTYRQIMARYETAEHSKIPMPGGLKKGRKINWVNVDSHASTHVMFTGITGSGKTNTIQAFISAIVEKQSPDDVVFILIDLKAQGDFNELREAPHVLEFDGQRIITDIPHVLSVLQQVRAEMLWRQRYIGAVAKKLTDYNKRVPNDERLPRIVILFDEYAATRLNRYKDEASQIDDICTDITQRGRSAGVHLWIGVQQPRKGNMPGVLQDNFTTKFVGHQASVGAAMSVTGNRQALKLNGIPGRMGYNNGPDWHVVQMPLIYEEDIDNAVRVAQDQYGDAEIYQLHSEGYESPAIKSTREWVLESALAVDGLKKRKVWEYLKPRYTLSQIEDVVDEIIRDEMIEFDGVMYAVTKQPGNYYTLEKADT
ncbi:MAG: FtsK/SpoIIIE domain-containing protein, partial [Chloroflexota bacterium]